MVVSELLTVQQVMQQLHVSDETIYRYIRNGKLKATRVGGLWRVSQEAMDEFLSSGGIRNVKEPQSTASVSEMP